mmetsp:Transcript_59418/g.128970  ORF Transcript_59418/g.128970 Transcript_59418/m.128970 type:complete len:297 (-) Transcript_59418:383-1273(-)
MSSDVEKLKGKKRSEAVWHVPSGQARRPVRVGEQRRVLVAADQGVRHRREEPWRARRALLDAAPRREREAQPDAVRPHQAVHAPGHRLRVHQGLPARLPAARDQRDPGDLAEDHAPAAPLLRPPESRRASGLPQRGGDPGPPLPHAAGLPPARNRPLRAEAHGRLGPLPRGGPGRRHGLRRAVLHLHGLLLHGLRPRGDARAPQQVLRGGPGVRPERAGERHLHGGGGRAPPHRQEARRGGGCPGGRAEHRCDLPRADQRLPRRQASGRRARGGLLRALSDQESHVARRSARRRSP